MADRDFASLVYRVNPIVPGCPYPFIVQALRDAAIRVCERSLAWRYQIPLFDLAPGVASYRYATPDGTDVHAVFDVLINGNRLERLTMEQAIEKYPNWADLFSGESLQDVWIASDEAQLNGAEYNETTYNGNALTDSALKSSSTPRSVTQINTNEFIVLPLPDDARAYSCRMFVALKPTRTASSMDSTALDNLEDAIIHAALQQLLAVPGQTWSNTDLAGYHAKQALYHTAERRARANLSNMRGTIRAQMQPFGA